MSDIEGKVTRVGSRERGQRTSFKLSKICIVEDLQCARTSCLFASPESYLISAMQPGEALSTAAQIAVALAGFAGVVVAFRSSSLHEWSLLDKFRLRLLLGSALVPLFSCLFGMLLLTFKPTPFPIWRWGSGFSLLLICIFGFFEPATPIRIRARGN